MSEKNIPIAVIGIGCRFPGGADDPEKLWSMLASGRNGGRTVPRNRWNWESFYHPDPATKEALNWKHGYFLGTETEDSANDETSELLSAFDSRFFDISPREAATMDPQQRLLLETVYEALEQAGLTLEKMRGSDTSVHMAIFARDYDRMGYQDGSQLPHLHLTGTGDAILSARISYLFDLRGPCHTLDTGCSGSMVSVHAACETLRTGEATVAIAGGSQLLLSPDQSIALSCIGIANKDGKCYVFDDRGQGYGRGEGVAALVLKRLDLALQDGDPIHGIVVGSGVNHDGRTKGIYLPNAEAQEALTRSVYARAGLEPTETLYVEAHGTGTEVGDAAEVQSISRVFGKEAGRPEGTRLRIGSIKANIGHLESVSGASGLIKALMVLKKNQIPPQLNLINPKPSLRLEERNIEVPVQLTQLAAEGHLGPKRVSVNCFGYGGTNAHVILEAYNEIEDEGYLVDDLVTDSHSSLARSPHLILLTANSERSLRQSIANLRQWLLRPANSDSDAGASILQDLSHTLCTRRSMLPWRCSVVASTISQLADFLADDTRQVALTKVNKASKQGSTNSIPFPLAFIFTGQGSQWFAMGRELLLNSTTTSSSIPSETNAFRSTIARFNDVLHGKAMSILGHDCDWDLEEELLRDANSSRLGEARIAQPATTAVQVALVDLLASWGIRPHAVCGHSSGEIAAAYAAGKLDLEGAARISYLRGVVSSSPKTRKQGTGAMLAVGEGETDVTERIKTLNLAGKVVVACVNSPQSTTVSGDVDAVEKLASLLDDEHVFNRRLRVDAAYHSHHMAFVAEDYLELLRRAGVFELDSPQPKGKANDQDEVVFISSVTAERKLTGFGPEYWVDNLVSQVKFSSAVQLVSAELGKKSTAVSSGGNGASSILIEVGPHSALMGPVRQCLSRESTGADFKYSYIPCLARNSDALQTILELAGRLVVAGWPVALDLVLTSTDTSKRRRPRVLTTLPTYAWDHSPLPGTNKAQLWNESRLSKSHRLRPFPYHDLLGLLDVASAPSYEPRWRFHVSLQTLPWLADHVVDGFVVFPGAAYLTMAIEAAKQQFWMRAGTDSRAKIKTIHFKDVSFIKPVIINGENPDGSYPEVELIISLSRDRQHYGNISNVTSGWDYYRVLSYNPQSNLPSEDKDAWTEHSSGLISIESETDDQQHVMDEVEGTREQQLMQAAALAALNHAQTASTEEMSQEQFYRDLEASGNAFGPTFQGVKSICLGKFVGVSKVVVPDISGLVSKVGHQRYYMQPHLIHPAVLDAVTQLQAQVFRRECSAAPVMPVSIAELSFAADLLDARPGSEITVALELEAEGKRGNGQGKGSRSAMGRLWAFQKTTSDNVDGMRTVITSSGMNLRAIGEAKTPVSSDINGQPFDRLTANNSRIEWKQDPDTITQQDFLSTVSRLGLFDVSHDAQNRSTSTMTAADKIDLGDQVATIFVRRALDQLRERNGDIGTLKKNSAALMARPYLTKLLDWMVTLDGDKKFSDAQNPVEKEQLLIKKAAADNAIGQALALIGPRLADIFTDPAEDALKMLVADGLLERIYADHMSASPYAQAAAYLTLLAHKRPGMRVLEIGAGTGGATLPLMDCLDMNKSKSSGRLLLESYTFTDISAGFFERARTKLSRWMDHEQVLFKTMDISRDPAQQGFEPASYDLIIASNVLHATSSIDATLANVRGLLKPGTGRLLTIEATRLTAAVNVIFGNFEGWWMYTGVGGGKTDEERRGAHSPLLSVSQWDAVLKRNAFSGAELAVPDHIGDSAFIHLMVSRAVEPMKNGMNGHQQDKLVKIIGASHCVNQAIHRIQTSLSQRGMNHTKTCIELEPQPGGEIESVDIDIDHDAVYLVVDSPQAGHGGSGYLLERSEKSAALFGRVQRLLTQTRNLVWVSVYDSDHSTPPPASTMITGMARVVRRENPGFRFVTVLAEADIFGADMNSDALADICLSSFWPPSPTEQAEEWEYMICKNPSPSLESAQIMIPRLVPDTSFADYVESVKPEWAMLDSQKATNRNKDEDEDADLVEAQYLNSARPLQLKVHTPGLLSSLRFVDNPSGVLDPDHSPLGPDEIHLEAIAYGINFKDVLIALGQLPPGTAMASEICGRVTAVGHNMTSLFRIGDRVVGAFAAPFGSHVRVSNGNGYYVVPDSISSTDAASIPLIFYTAWYCLVSVARLQKGQSVLIHAASGGVGQAAIQFAQLAGAGDIFVTVGSAEKKRLVQEQYGIPDSHIFSSHPGRSGFKKGVLRLTAGKGVDVVLNSLSGEMLADSWECIAAFGTFVEIGKTDILKGSRLNMAPFEKQVTFASVDLTHIYHAKPEATRAGMAEILDLFDRRVLKPVYPVNVYPMSEIQDAFRLMAARKHMGKQVVVADQTTLVKATRPTTATSPGSCLSAPALTLKLEPQGVYVIGGGLGDLGKRIALFLAAHGAGHIVTFSRRSLGPKLDADLSKLHDGLHKLGATLHTLQCNIADETSVKQAALALTNLGQPIRGVINAGLVLRDSMLEYMTHDDYAAALGPKVAGTLHLERWICDPDNTDFFITLSSVTTIVGLASQSNYCAGNAFQDAFAQTHSHQNRPTRTRYVSINVGAVQGSQQVINAKGLTKETGLMVSFDEFFTTLEYAMGPQARADGAVQSIMRINVEPWTKLASSSSVGLPNHIFDILSSLNRNNQARDLKKTDQTAAQPNKLGVGHAAMNASSVAEAEKIVATATAAKFAAFVGQDVGVNESVAGLGLDSLVTIELKNWVVHTFKVRLQASELTGARSIVALAALVVSRMDLAVDRAEGTVQQEQQPESKTISPAPAPEVQDKKATMSQARLPTKKQEQISATHITTPATTHGLECCAFSPILPVKPPPSLDDALDFWIEASSHLWVDYPEEWAAILADIAVIRSPQSPGRLALEEEILKGYGDGAKFNDTLTKGLWLSRRHLVSAVNTHADVSEFPHSQAERAAIIAQAVVKFRHDMASMHDKEPELRIEPLRVAGRPICTWAWQYLFNSVREPRRGTDEMVRYSHGADHLVALRKGRVFKIPVLADDGVTPVSLESLRATFDALLAYIPDSNDDNKDAVWTGMLTTDNRDSWADVRQRLITNSINGAEYLQVIESAVTVISLDSCSPRTPEEKARQVHPLNGLNRWFDKPLQFCIGANGTSCAVVEHGHVDGLDLTPLWGRIASAIKTYRSPGTRLHSKSMAAVALNEIVLPLDPDTAHHIATLKSKLLQLAGPDGQGPSTPYAQISLPELGTKFLLARRAPVKAVIDVTFLLAARLFLGRCVAAITPVGVAHFHRSRVDIVLTMTPAVKAFCDAAACAYDGTDKLDVLNGSNGVCVVDSNRARDKASLVALLHAASSQLTAGVQAALAGKSHIRVFELVAWLWKQQQQQGEVQAIPRFLADKLFRGRPDDPHVNGQTMGFEADLGSDNFLYFDPKPNLFWACLMPHADEVRVSICGGSEQRTAGIAKCLHRAAVIIRDILSD